MYALVLIMINMDFTNSYMIGNDLPLHECNVQAKTAIVEMQQLYSNKQIRKGWALCLPRDEKP